MTETSTRKSVPVSAESAEAVSSLRLDIVWQRAALELAGVEVPDEPSEAQALSALLTVGHRVLAEHVREQAMAEGYAALALTITDEDRAISRALTSRTAARID